MSNVATMIPWILGVLLSFVAGYVTSFFGNGDHVFLSALLPFTTIFFIPEFSTLIGNFITEATITPSLGVFFGVGVLFEAFSLLYLNNKLTRKNISSIFLFISVISLGLVGPLFLFPISSSSLDVNPNISFLTILMAIVLAGSTYYAVHFNEYLLTKVNKLVVLLWTFLLGYMYLESGLINIMVSFPLAIIATIILFVCLRKSSMGPLASVLMYLWYLLCISIVTILLFFIQNNSQHDLSFNFLFSFGLISFFFIIHFVQILFFQPLFMLAAIKEKIPYIEKHTEFIHSLYENKEFSYREIFFFISILIVLGYFNIRFDILPTFLIVLLITMFSPYFLSKKI